MAANRLGCEQVPVDYQDYASEAEEWADLIADNRLSELSQWQRGELKDILQELDTGALDMELTGYDAAAMEALMSEFHVPDNTGVLGENGYSYKEQFAVIVICADEPEQCKVYERLNAEGYSCKVVAT